MLGLGVLLVCEYFDGEGYDSGGIMEFYMGVRILVLTSFYSLSSAVMLHRYLALDDSL